MSIKIWNALLVIALLIVLSGGGYILYQNNAVKQAEKSREQAAAAQAEQEEKERKAQKAAALKQQVDDFINGFLVDIKNEMREYKKGRAVLNELGTPANLREKAYIAENAKLAEKTVLDLQLQMDDVMSSFERADIEAQDLIARFEDSEQTLVQTRWGEVRDENAEKFMNFFASEEDILMAKLRLLEFYAENKDILTVDVVNDHIVFDALEKQEQEALLRARIMELEAEQKDLLKRDSQKPDPAED